MIYVVSDVQFLFTSFSMLIVASDMLLIYCIPKHLHTKTSLISDEETGPLLEKYTYKGNNNMKLP